MIAISYGEMTNVDRCTTLIDEYILDDISLPSYSHREFKFDDLGAALDLALLYEESHGNRQIRDYCAQMLTRFKWIKEREEFAFLRVPPEELNQDERHLERFVERFLGVARREGQLRESAQIIILDMNEAADEVVELGGHFPGAGPQVAGWVFDLEHRRRPDLVPGAVVDRAETETLLRRGRWR